MKMAALSQVCDLPVGTIKYYLREGLIPPGTRSAPNQADYDDHHVRRLRLIRALVDVGGLPLGTVRTVLAAMDDERLGMHDVLGRVHHALAISDREVDPSDRAESIEEINEFLDRLGWQVKQPGPAVRELARTLTTLRRLGWHVSADVFAPYADAADRLAAWELEQTPYDAPRTQVIEAVVVGTVVFETALIALRRLAEEHHSAERERNAQTHHGDR